MTREALCELNVKINRAFVRWKPQMLLLNKMVR